MGHKLHRSLTSQKWESGMGKSYGVYLIFRMLGNSDIFCLNQFFQKHISGIHVPSDISNSLDQDQAP